MSEFWEREREILEQLGGVSTEFCSGSDDPDAAAFVDFVMNGGEYKPSFAKWMPKERGVDDGKVDSVESWPDDYSYQQDGKPPLKWVEQIVWSLGGL